MKKNLKKRAFLFLIITLGCFYFGQIEAGSYYYDNIEVKIFVNKDSTFNVEEGQTYYLDGNFGYFYRDIELKKIDHISDVEVFDNKGAKLAESEYDLKYKGNKLHIQWNFERRDFSQEVKSWTVKYKVHGGLGFFDNYDEIYWNAIFPDREVEIRKAEVFVYLPEEVKEIKTRLFVGELGSTKESPNFEIINSKTVKFWAENIRPGEFLTIVVAFPKGLVEKPLFYRNQLLNLITLFIALFLPIFIFSRCFIIWRRKGKDPKIKKTIIAQYEPPQDLPPALVGLLMKQKIEVKEILATVVNLAVRGYLRIREEEKKVLFIKNKEYIFEKLKKGEELSSFEKKIMEALFKKDGIVSSKELRNKFYKELPGIKKEIFIEMAKTNLFDQGVSKKRKKYSLPYVIVLILAVLIIMAAVVLAGQYLFSVLIFGLSLVVSAVIGLVFAYFMPFLTSAGLEAKWKALGFKEYLQIAERFRLGAETLETFSRFLPYAIIFDVEKKWAKRFSDFEYQKQSWYYPAAVYSGPGGTPGSFSEFSSSFSSFSNSLSSVFGSSPSGAGAGGAAGGGGGGGGGGAG